MLFATSSQTLSRAVWCHVFHCRRPPTCEITISSMTGQPQLTAFELQRSRLIAINRQRLESSGVLECVAGLQQQHADLKKNKRSNNDSLKPLVPLQAVLRSRSQQRSSSAVCRQSPIATGSDSSGIGSCTSEYSPSNWDTTSNDMDSVQDQQALHPSADDHPEEPETPRTHLRTFFDQDIGVHLPDEVVDEFHRQNLDTPLLKQGKFVRSSDCLSVRVLVGSWYHWSIVYCLSAAIGRSPVQACTRPESHRFSTTACSDCTSLLVL